MFGSQEAGHRCVQSDLCTRRKAGALGKGCGLASVNMGLAVKQTAGLKGQGILTAERQ